MPANRQLYFSFIINKPTDVHVYYRDEKRVSYFYDGVYLMTSISEDGRSAVFTKKEFITEKEVKEYNKTLDREDAEKFVTVDNDGALYREYMSKIRLKQGAFRESLINNFGENCMLCKAKGKEYIIASHIKPYSKCRSYEASDYKNGLLLCPNHDKLFDLGHITFDDEGKIIVSNHKKEVRILLSDHVNELPKDYKNNQYLKYHRKHIFLDR